MRNPTVLVLEKMAAALKVLSARLLDEVEDTPGRRTSPGTR